MVKTKKIIITFLTTLLLLCNSSIVFADEDEDNTNDINNNNRTLLQTSNDIDYTNQLDIIERDLQDLKNNLYDIYDDVVNPKFFNEYVIKKTIKQYPFIMTMFDSYKYSYHNLLPLLNKETYIDLLNYFNYNFKNITIFYDYEKPDRLYINCNDLNIVASTFHTSSLSLKYSYTYDLKDKDFQENIDKLGNNHVMILYLQVDSCVLYDGLTDINNQIDLSEIQTPIDMSGIENLLPVIIVILLFLLFKNLIWGV